MEDLLNQIKLQQAQFKLVTFGITITDQEVDNHYRTNPVMYTEPKRVKLRVIVVDTDAQKDVVDKALAAGYAEMRPSHLAWWKKFWSQSSVTLPLEDLAISRQYHLVQYFHGAASRRGAPPMPLQGVWTADNGGLPPWKGDYHNDLNTQMTYIAYQTAGRFAEGSSFLDLMWDLLPAFRKFAKEFYGTGGAAVPGVLRDAGVAAEDLPGTAGRRVQDARARGVVHERVGAGRREEDRGEERAGRPHDRSPYAHAHRAAS